MEGISDDVVELVTQTPTFFVDAGSQKEDHESSDHAHPQDPAFPVVLHRMLDDAEALGFDDIVSWLPCGEIFKVHKRKDFEDKIMGRYFQNQTRYKSFLRQLNLYGFHRITKGTQKGNLSHENFKRNYPLLCGSIRRRRRPRLCSDSRGGVLRHQLYKTISNQVPEICDRRTDNATQQVSSTDVLDFSQEVEISIFNDELASEIIATFGCHAF